LGGSAEKGVSFGGEHGRGQLLENEGFKKSAHGKRGKCEGGGIAPSLGVIYLGKNLCSGYILGAFLFSGYCLGG